MTGDKLFEILNHLSGGMVVRTNSRCWKGEKKMSKNEHVRWGWLRFMYIYTIVGAGGFGAGIILMPDVMQTAFRFPSQDPIVFGVVGSVYMAFGLLSILGLKSPLKFAPVLLLQLCYKGIWFVGIVLPFLFSGRFPLYATTLLIIFATYIIGDLVAIPFASILSKQTDS
jgi:hypothetical protein